MAAESSPQPASPSPGRQIARAAGTVAAAFALTQLLGLARDVLIGRAFGTSANMDSYNAANQVTNLLFNLMAGGALGSAFIPTFTGLLAKEQRANAWKLASAIFNLLLLVLTVISLLAALFAPWIVHNGLYLLAPGQDAGQEQLTIKLLRMMLPTVVIFGLSGLVMGILNAHQKFWLPAIAPAMYSIGQILGVVSLPASMGVERLAYGAVLGSVLHLLVQTPHLVRLGGKFSFELGLRIAEVREVLRLMGPRILGVAVVQINLIVNTIIALGLPEGSVTSINLAFRWMYMPLAAIAQSIAIAAMPTFSAQAALGKLEDMRSSLAASLRGVILLALPASIGLIFLRTPLIRLLYENAEFTALSTQMVTWALLWYSAGLLGHSLLEVIVRAFYALQDTRTPVTVGIIAMSLNIVFSLLFSRLFSSLGWMPHGGLALANSLATYLETSVLLFLLNRRLQGFHSRKVSRGLLEAAAGTLGMGLALWAATTFVRNIPDLWLLVGGVAVGGLVYAGVLIVLRVPELALLKNYLQQKLKR